MSYAPLDVHFDEHPKYEELELEHFGLMACAIAYCNRNLTDGKVSFTAVRRFGKSMKGPKLAKRLVELGIWRDVDSGWEIVGFLDHNPSRAEVMARREESRVRKQRQRRGSTPDIPPPDVPPTVPPGQPPGRDAGQTAGRPAGHLQGLPAPASPARARNSDSDSETDPDATQDGGPRDRPAPLTRAEEPFWIAAYVDAVKGVTGAAWGFPSKQIGGLRAAIEAHCLDRSRIDDWLRATVGEFVQATKDRPMFWASHGPDGLLKWLNARRPTDEAVSSVRVTAASGASERARRDLSGYEP